jgi:hypothetical protein
VWFVPCYTVVQEGASYTSAEDVSAGDWDAVMASIEPAAADINGGIDGLFITGIKCFIILAYVVKVKANGIGLSMHLPLLAGARFCKTDADGTSDLREAFEPCPPAAAAADPTAGSALPMALLKPEKGAAFVGCYLGFIPSDASMPTDVGFYERIALGMNTSGLMDARAKRAFRVCAGTCAGYPHMATAVVPGTRTEPRGLVLECLCTFRLAHGESHFAVTRDDKCAGHLDAQRGCVAGPCGTAKQSAVFSLPNVNYTTAAAANDNEDKVVVEALGAEYLGCYNGYSGWVGPGKKCSKCLPSTFRVLV